MSLLPEPYRHIVRSIVKKLLLCIAIVLAWNSAVFAAPHITKSIPEPPEYPGPRLQERFAQQAAAGIMNAHPSTNGSAATVNILLLRVEFQPGTSNQTTGNGQWQSYTVGSDPNYWVTRASTYFTSYYKEVSNGLLNVVIDVSPKIYKVQNVMSYYGGGTSQSIENFIYDSISTASTDTIVWNNYDAVLIVHAGIGQETDQSGTKTGDLWSLYYRGGTNICQNAAGTGSCLPTLLKGGVLINEAIIMPQTDSRTGLTVDPLGVYVHEFGHWLGLPDLYCTNTTNPSACPTEGVGNWSLMDEDRKSTRLNSSHHG
jgi:hypothetical protein